MALPSDEAEREIAEIRRRVVAERAALSKQRSAAEPPTAVDDDQAPTAEEDADVGDSAWQTDLLERLHRL